MAHAPLDLVLPPDLDVAAAAALLARHLEVDVGRPQGEERVYVDTFDGRLRAAGLTASHHGGRAATVTLSLHDPGAPPRSATVPRARRVLAADLPRGPIRDRLGPVMAARALLTVVTVRHRVQPVGVLNRDGKTVVRLEIEQATVAAKALAPRLHVRPVLGYDADFERTLRLLTAELGLLPAGMSLFDDAVLATGGRPEGVSSKVDVRPASGMRADRAAGAVLARLAEIAQVNVPGTIDDLDPEFLHDLRVAVRRARSVLREMAGVHDPPSRAHLREELKWVQQVTGPVRDLDVQLLEWDDLTSGLPGGRGGDLGPLRALLQARRAAALRALRRTLRGRRFAAALAAWKAFAADPGAAQPRSALAISAVAGDRIRRVHARMVKDGLAIGDDSRDESLHDLRKRGKELRYLLELFGSLYPKAVVKPLVASLKDLQDVLGRFQDRAVQAELLRGLGAELAGAEGGPGALMALGLVVEELEADQRIARAQFAERFSAFAAKDQRRLVADTFPELPAS